MGEGRNIDLGRSSDGRGAGGIECVLPPFLSPLFLLLLPLSISKEDDEEDARGEGEGLKLVLLSKEGEEEGESPLLELRRGRKLGLDSNGAWVIADDEEDDDNTEEDTLLFVLGEYFASL